MKALGRIKPGLWVTLVLATASVGYTLFVFLPRQRQIMRAHAEMNQKRKFIVETTRLLASIELAEKQLEKANVHVDRYSTSTVGEAELAQLYATISERAAEAKIAIVRFSPGQALRMNVIHQIPVTIACRGEFHPISAFLADLESLPQSTWIDNLRISPIEPNEPDLKCEFKLTIFVEDPGFAEST